ISHDGAVTYTDSIHFLPLSNQTHVEPIFFPVALKELDHFELRPFGGRHRFFFDAVQLSKISKQAFAPPPKITIPVNGKPIEQSVTALVPLGFKVATFRGDE